MIIGFAGYSHGSFLRFEIYLIPCQILSIAFEFAEYSLQHQLANFAEVCEEHSHTVFRSHVMSTVLVGSCKSTTGYLPIVYAQSAVSGFWTSSFAIGLEPILVRP